MHRTLVACSLYIAVVLTAALSALVSIAYDVRLTRDHLQRSLVPVPPGCNRAWQLQPGKGVLLEGTVCPPGRSA
jgi:hypothetical protein